jgi:hypothetical protein
MREGLPLQPHPADEIRAVAEPAVEELDDDALGQRDVLGFHHFAHASATERTERPVRGACERIGRGLRGEETVRVNHENLVRAASTGPAASTLDYPPTWALKGASSEPSWRAHGWGVRIILISVLMPGAAAVAPHGPRRSTRAERWLHEIDGIRGRFHAPRGDLVSIALRARRATP